ncbi:DNA-binding protein [Fodinibius sediminis]|uniref:Magnetosome protein MamS/MamX domain-containing protein n=1 Tax=Fodinibius sediminis TaxID=1214077 RepID=A0A521E3T3_9BACT|nr:DNA-binding protein [Fodinibius sediminis]SMO78608.1 hypothetical protein SAMN06265218_11333 [Fodinibius sediminis]
MKPLFTSFSLTLIICLITVPTLWAQRGMGRGQDAMQSYTRPFDTTTVETISGEVMEVTYTAKNRKAITTGVHLLLQTGEETVPVHLGPAWFIDRQEPFNKGDTITVTGSRITFNNDQAIIASQIVRNQMTLQLRNREGYPLWKGWRRSQGVSN